MTSSKYSKSTKEWARQWQRCWRCPRHGTWPDSLLIHHFVRGSFRNKNDLATTVMLCPECHDAEHNGDAVGLLGMLVLKRRLDPEQYDRERVNHLRGRAANAITEEEVDQFAGSGDDF